MQIGEITGGSITTTAMESGNEIIAIADKKDSPPGASPTVKETVDPNTGKAYERGKLYNISIIDFLNNPNQPRKVFDPDSLEELAASIKQHGILEPVLFQPGTQGYVTIVAGERRIAAAKKAGVNVIPAVCVEGNASEIALVENLLRQDLTAVEEAEAMKRLMDEQRYTQEQLSGVIGKARTTTNEILSLNRLPKEVRDDCRGNRAVTREALLQIAKKKQERSMITAYNKYKEKLQKGDQPRQKKSPADTGSFQSVSELAGTMTTRLNNLDPANWADEDKNKMRDILTGLKDAVDSCLNSPGLTEKKASLKAAVKRGRPKGK